MVNKSTLDMCSILNNLDKVTLLEPKNYIIIRLMEKISIYITKKQTNPITIYKFIKIRQKFIFLTFFIINIKNINFQCFTG